MKSMNCFECVYKHLAAALSYGKQIIGGFDSNNDLNHQIDFLGQLINAEHHLELIQKSYYNQLREYRKQCQEKKFKFSERDLEFIRKIYKKVSDLQNMADKFQSDNYIKKIKESSINFNQEKFTIVFPQVTNKDYFDFSFKMLNKNLTNEFQIIVQKTSLDLSEYKVRIDSNYLDYLQDDYFLYIKQNMTFIHQFDLKHFINGYETFGNKKDYTFQPQMIKKSLYQYQGMNQYFSKFEQKRQIDTRSWVVSLNKEICCRNKQKITSYPIAVFQNDLGFSALKDYFSDK